MLDYQKILNQNMVNVLKDILIDIKKNGLTNGNHLYITFLTNHKSVKIPDALKVKYPSEMTIIIQHEYSGIIINKTFFSITLSFNNILSKLNIGYDAIVSFADPSANFGLRLQINKIKNQNKSVEKNKNRRKDNIIDFSNYKKN